MGDSERADQYHQEVTCEGAILAPRGWGTTVTLPPGAVPAGESVLVRLQLSFDWSTATDGSLFAVSPMLLFSPASYSFQQPISVRLPHCSAGDPLRLQAWATRDGSKWANLQIDHQASDGHVTMSASSIGIQAGFGEQVSGLFDGGASLLGQLIGGSSGSSSGSSGGDGESGSDGGRGDGAGDGGGSGGGSDCGDFAGVGATTTDPLICAELVAFAGTGNIAVPLQLQTAASFLSRFALYPRYPDGAALLRDSVERSMERSGCPQLVAASYDSAGFESALQLTVGSVVEASLHLANEDESVGAPLQRANSLGHVGCALTLRKEQPCYEKKASCLAPVPTNAAVWQGALCARAGERELGQTVAVLPYAQQAPPPPPHADFAAQSAAADSAAAAAYSSAAHSAAAHSATAHSATGLWASLDGGRGTQRQPDNPFPLAVTGGGAVPPLAALPPGQLREARRHALAVQHRIEEELERRNERGTQELGRRTVAMAEELEQQGLQAEALQAKMQEVMDLADHAAEAPVEEVMRSGLVQVGVALPGPPPPGHSRWVSVRTPGLAQPEMHVLGVGSGFLFDERGLVFTCEHVRSECQAHINGAAFLPGFEAPLRGFIVVAPYVGGPTDWSLGWITDVLAYTRDWNGHNSHLPPDPCVPRMDDPRLTPGEAYADAAVLRATACLASGVSVRAQNPLLSPGTEDRVSVMRLDTGMMPEDGCVNGAYPELRALGFPSLGGTTPTIERVCLSPAIADAHGLWLKSTSGIMPGHSGGPVVDRQGNVVAWNVRDCSVRVDKMSHLRHIALGVPCIQAARARAFGLGQP